MYYQDDGWVMLEGVELAIDTSSFGILVYRDEYIDVEAIPVAKLLTTNFSYLTKWQGLKVKAFAIYQIIKA